MFSKSRLALNARVLMFTQHFRRFASRRDERTLISFSVSFTVYYREIRGSKLKLLGNCPTCVNALN